MARPFHELLTDCSCSGQRSVVRGSNHFVCFKASKAESFGVYRHHTTHHTGGNWQTGGSRINFRGFQRKPRSGTLPSFPKLPSHIITRHTYQPSFCSVLKRAQAVRKSDVDHDISSAEISLDKLYGSSHRTVFPLSPSYLWSLVLLFWP